MPVLGVANKIKKKNPANKQERASFTPKKRNSTINRFIPLKGFNGGSNKKSSNRFNMLLPENSH